jgi:hypothetical protein
LSEASGLELTNRNEREDDMIWRLRWGGRWLYVYLLLEFQSSVDRFMAVQLLTYIGLLYQDLAAAGEIPRGSHLRAETAS